VRFGTCNVRSKNKTGSLRAVGEEISIYKLNLVGVQEVRWDGGGTERAGEYTFFYGKGNENHELGIGFLLHKRIISAVKYGCETWSLTLREEHRLRVFENRVLRRTFKPKRDEVTGGWRKPQNEEHHNLYSSPSIITMIRSRRTRWAGNVARMGKKRNAYRLLVGKPEGKRPTGKTKM
jgi:hypothetical protein